MKKDTSEADFASHMKRITEGELWELLGTVGENVNNIRVTDDVISCDKDEYSSHSLAEVVDREYNND